jgi:transposase
MTCYVGLDVSLAETSVCVLEEDGRARFEGRVPSQPEAMIKCLREKGGAAQRIGMETSPTAGVLFRAIQSANLPVVCLETRHAHRVLSARGNKTDRNDARGLAELMRVGWFRAAWVRGASATYVRSLLQARRLLMQTSAPLRTRSAVLSNGSV